MQLSCFYLMMMWMEHINSDHSTVKCIIDNDMQYFFKMIIKKEVGGKKLHGIRLMK